MQDDKNNANKINDKRNAKKVKKHMTKNAMERLVEDLISESMAKGNVYKFIIFNFGNLSQNVFLLIYLID